MKLKVLVVEDDQLSLELIGEVLASVNMEVLGFRSAWDAIAPIDREKFDGVFLDLRLPGLDGLELARRIRRSIRNATTPIVVISGRSDRETVAAAFAAGAQFFLPKPIDYAKMRRLLNATHGSLLREQSRTAQADTPAG
jgi:DNA-binding response OmpR family regulator